MSGPSWALWAALISVGTAPPGTASTPAALMAEAERARARGELDASLELVRRAHALDPSPALLHNIAVLCESLGRYAEAAQAFRGVVDDARTPAEVRARDLERLDALEPKRAYAWLVVSSAGPRAVVYLDRELIAVGEEVRIPPGRHLLEIERTRSEALRVELLDLPAGRRTTVAIAPGGAPTTHAVVTLGHVAPPVSALEVDGARLRGVPPHDRLELPAGARRIRYLPYGETWEEVGLELSPGDARALGEAPGSVGTAVLTMPTPALGAEPVARWPQVVMAGGAVAALASGVVLSVSAASDRAEVEEAARDPSGVVVGLTYARAGELEAGADTKATAGAIALGVGAAAALAALVWWLSE